MTWGITKNFECESAIGITLNRSKFYANNNSEAIISQIRLLGYRDGEILICIQFRLEVDYGAFIKQHSNIKGTDSEDYSVFFDIETLDDVSSFLAQLSEVDFAINEITQNIQCTINNSQNIPLTFTQLITLLERNCEISLTELQFLAHLHGINNLANYKLEAYNPPLNLLDYLRARNQSEKAKTIITMLMQEGQIVSEENTIDGPFSQKTLLHYAIWRKWPTEFIKYILELQPDLLHQLNTGYSILMLPLSREVFELLIQAAKNRGCLPALLDLKINKQTAYVVQLVTYQNSQIAANLVDLIQELSLSSTQYLKAVSNMRWKTIEGNKTYEKLIKDFDPVHLYDSPKSLTAQRQGSQDLYEELFGVKKNIMSLQDAKIEKHHTLQYRMMNS